MKWGGGKGEEEGRGKRREGGGRGGGVRLGIRQSLATVPFQQCMCSFCFRCTTPLYPREARTESYLQNESNL